MLTKDVLKVIIIAWSKIFSDKRGQFMYKTTLKLKNILLSAAFAVCLFAPHVYADGVTVIIDGEEKNFSVEPIIVSERVMLPLRDTFEAVGAQVNWNDADYHATAEKGEKTVTVKPGSCELDINGEKLVMDVPALEQNDRIFIPVRFAAEAFDCTVLWNESTNTVNIYTTNNFEFYPEANVPVFSDVISSAVLVSEDMADGEKTYTYKTDYDAITEYIISLQKHFGFEPYSVDFEKDGGTTHVYVNTTSKDIVSITCGESADGYTAVIIPASYDENRNQSTEQTETIPGQTQPEPPAAEKPDATTEYYENTQNTLPTYTSITGAPLIEKVSEDGVDIYKYSDSFVGMMQYTMMITFYGYSEYSIDMDFGKITRYYSCGDTLIGITGSMLADEVWIIIPNE